MSGAVQQVPGLKLFDLQEHDLSVPGRVVIESRFQLSPEAPAFRHKHPGEEITYVLEGSVQYSIDGQALATHNAGDALIVPPETVHAVKHIRHRQRGPAVHVYRREREAVPRGHRLKGRGHPTLAGLRLRSRFGSGRACRSCGRLSGGGTAKYNTGHNQGAIMEKGSGIDAVHNFWEQVWQLPQNYDAIDDLVVEDFVIISGGRRIEGREAFKKWAEEFSATIGNFDSEIVDSFENHDGSRVAATFTITGTNNGALTKPTIAPSR